MRYVCDASVFVSAESWWPMHVYGGSGVIYHAVRIRGSYAFDDIDMDGVVFDGMSRYGLFLGMTDMLRVRHRLAHSCVDGESFFVVAYLDGSVLFVSWEEMRHTGFYERPFSLEPMSSVWRFDEVNRAISAAASGGLPHTRACASFGCAFLASLGCSGAYAASVFHSVVDAHLGFAYVGMLSHEFFVNGLGFLCTEISARLDDARIVELLDAGYALGVQLEVGAISPGCGGLLTKGMHFVVLLSVEGLGYVCVDQSGARIVTVGDIAGLCRFDESLGSSAWRSGCMVVGCRKERIVFSEEDVVRGVMSVREQRRTNGLVNMFDESVSYDVDASRYERVDEDLSLHVWGTGARVRAVISDFVDANFDDLVKFGGLVLAKRDTGHMVVESVVETKQAEDAFLYNVDDAQTSASSKPKDLSFLPSPVDVGSSSYDIGLDR